MQDNVDITTPARRIVTLSADDYVAARQLVAWLAYPDRPHMRARERDRSGMRHKAEGWMLQFLSSIAGERPRDAHGYIKRSRMAANMATIDRRLTMAMWAAHLREARGERMISAPLEIVTDHERRQSWAFGAPFNFFANAEERITKIRGRGDGTSDYHQQQSARERLFEPFKTVLHLAQALMKILPRLTNDWPTEWRIDPETGDRDIRASPNMWATQPIARLILFPEMWLNEVIADAERHQSLPREADPSVSPTHFQR